MRIRPVHIIILIVLAIGAFVLYAALLGGDRDERSPVTPPAPSSGAGTLPPVDADQSMVPVLEVETDTLDMGIVPNTEPTTKTLTVKNAGRQKLVIREVTTTCGACTTGKVTPSEIPAGETAALEVTFYPSGVPGFYSHKRLTLMSNAPNAPMQVIDVMAHIEPEFEAEPEVVEFGEVEKGQSVQRQVLLRQLGDEPIELLNVKPVDETLRDVSFAFSMRPEQEWQTPGKPEYEITATLEPWAPMGELTQAYEIVTTCTRVPRYRRQLKATIKGFYTLSNNRLSFTMRPGIPADGPLSTVTLEAERPVEIVDAKVTGEEFTVKIVPGSTPNTVTIELYPAAKITAGRKSEELAFFVKTDDGTLLPNVLPVHGMVLDGQ